MEKTIATLLIVGSVCFFYLRADAAQTAPAPAASVHTAAITRDSLPSGKITVKQQINGKSLEAKLENGKIIALRVDGKDIPEETFGAYEAQVSALLEKIPARPPVPPRPETPPTPEMPKSHFFFFDEDMKPENREVIIDLNGTDTVILEGTWSMQGQRLSEEMAKQYEEHAKRFEEQAKRMAEQGVRMRINIDKRLNDRLPGDAKERLEKRLEEGLERLEGLDLDMSLGELPGFQLDGSFNTREDGAAEELGIFEFRPGSKMNTQQQLERALLRDELIARNEMYKFELSDRVLKINGDKLPDSLRKKYIRLYEDASGMEWDAKNRVVIHKTPEM